MPTRILITITSSDGTTRVVDKGNLVGLQAGDQIQIQEWTPSMAELYPDAPVVEADVEISELSDLLTRHVDDLVLRLEGGQVITFQEFALYLGEEEGEETVRLVVGDLDNPGFELDSLAALENFEAMQGKDSRNDDPARPEGYSEGPDRGDGSRDDGGSSDADVDSNNGNGGDGNRVGAQGVSSGGDEGDGDEGDKGDDYAPNQVPIAIADKAGTQENGEIAIDVLANDTDPDGSADNLTIKSATVIDGLGSVAIVGGKLVYAPGNDYDYLKEGDTASVTVAYTMADEHGTASSSTVTVTVTGTNDGPTAVADAANATENAAIDIDVLANDTDVDDGHSFTLDTIDDVTGGGNATIVDNQVRFDPGADFDHLKAGDTATVTIAYTMTDEHGASSSSTATVTVTGANDIPVAVSDTADTTENAAIAIDVLANDTDVDDGHSFTLDTIDGVTGGGTAAIANNQVRFDSGTDFDHLKAGDTATVTIAYTMADEHGAASSSTVTVTVTGTNDGPAAVADAVGTTENTAIDIDVLANDTDPDDGAVLTLTDASVPQGQGSVAVVNGQVRFDPGTDFDYLKEGDTATVTIAYTMTDEHGAASSSTVTVTVTGANDGPVAVADAANVAENTAIDIDVLANDTDPDDGHSFTLDTIDDVTGGGNATIVDNQVRFDPGTDFDHLNEGDTATVTIAYTMTDEHGASSSSTATVTVTGANDIPVAVSDTADATENAAIDINVLANDTDVDDGAVLTLTDASVPQGQGTADIVNGQVRFDPGSDFDHLAKDATQQVTIAYTMTDEHGAASSSTVTVTVTGTNDGPTAVADAANATENAAIDIDVLANDTDVDDGHSFTLDTIDDVTGGGNATIVDNQVRFDPGTDFDHLNEGDTATVTIAYTMTDEHGASSSSTATVTVTGANDIPVAVSDTADATENAAIDIDVLANDTDPDDGHSFTLNAIDEVTGGGNATIADNQIHFDPGTDFDHLKEGDTATVTIAYTMADEHGAASSSTVTVTVTGTNDGPAAVADTAGATENNAIDIDVLANDTDPDDGAVLTLTEASVPQGQGSVAILNGQVRFDPSTDFDHLAKDATRQVTIAYTITDEHGAATSSTVTVTVTGTNDGPTAVADAVGTTENTAIAIDVLANDTDPDDGHSFTLDAIDHVTGGGNATIVDNQVRFDPGTDFDHLNEGDTATVTIAYTMTDEHGAASSSTVTVTVTGTNDGPATVADTAGTTENTAIDIDVLANDTDPDDGAVLTLTEASVPQGQGSVAVVNGQVRFDPGTDFDYLKEGDTATVTIAYTMTDEHGAASSSTVTVTVTGANDGPVAVADAANVAENTAIDIDVLANDTDPDDGHSFTLDAIDHVTGGGTAVIADNQVRFDPGADFDYLKAGATATVTIAYTMTDEHGAPSSSTATVTVTGTNDTPVAMADTANTAENAAIDINVLANDTDVDDGAVLTLTDASVPQGQGTADIVNGQVRFDPGTDFDHLKEGDTATVTIAYSMTDEYGVAASSTVTVTVTGTNDAPVAVADTASTSENIAVDIDVLANDFDYEGSVFSLTGANVSSSGGGTVTIVDNQVHFDPGSDYDDLAEGETEEVEITYTVQDTEGLESTGTAVVTLTGTNDAPVAQVDGVYSPEIQVGTTTEGHQSNPSITSLPDGGFVVTWNSQAEDGRYDIWAQRYDSSGNTVGDEFLINTATAADGTDQTAPSVTCLTDGSFVVTWDSGADIVGQRFTGDWAADGTQFTINTNAAYSYRDLASVVGLEDGGFVVVWRGGLPVTSYPGWTPPPKMDICARRYDADGNPVGNEFTVSTGGTSDYVDDRPSVASLADGGFIVAWDWGHRINTSAADMYSRRYTIDSDGNAVAGDWVKHASWSGHYYSTVTGLEDGGYVVAWQANGEIAGQRYDSDGVRVASFTANTYTSSTQGVPEVTGLADGGFVVTWQSSGQDGSGYGIYGQRYGADGSPVGEEFRINIETASDQSAPTVTALADGGFAVAWQSYNQDGDGWGVFTRVFSDSEAIETVDDLVVDVLANDTDLDNGAVLTLVSAELAGDKGSIELVDGKIRFIVGDDFKHLVENTQEDVRIDYTISDENGAESTSQLYITVIGANDAPIAVVDTASYAHRIADIDNTASADLIDVLANDWDFDDGAILTLVSAGVTEGGGSVVIEDGKIKFIPGNDFDHLFKDDTEPVVITYTIEDENGATATSTVNLTVTGTDDDPILRADTAETTENAVIDIDVLANDINAGETVMTIVETSVEGGGSVSIVDNQVRFDPGGDFDHLAEGVTEEVVITYAVEDDSGAGSRSESTVTVTVTGTNDGPVAAADTAGTAENVATPVANDEFQVNTYTSSWQDDSSAAALSGGGFVVIWRSYGQDGDGSGIYGQLYGADGDPVGEEFLVNTYTTDYQGTPCVASLADGGFVVTWISDGQDGSRYGICGQRYGADGSAVGDEFQVNTVTYHDQETPSVTGLANGGFVVTWASFDPENGDYGGEYCIKGQRYGADGSPVGDEFQISSYEETDQDAPAVASLSGGGFVVIWISDIVGTSNCKICGQIYDSAGEKVGDEFRVDTDSTDYSNTRPSVTELSGGGFVVVWDVQVYDGDNYQSHDIYGQRYAADGTKVGDAFQINSSSSYYSTWTEPSVTSLADGGLW